MRRFVLTILTLLAVVAVVAGNPSRPMAAGKEKSMILQIESDLGSGVYSAQMIKVHGRPGKTYRLDVGPGYALAPGQVVGVQVVHAGGDLLKASAVNLDVPQQFADSMELAAGTETPTGGGTQDPSWTSFAVTLRERLETGLWVATRWSDGAEVVLKTGSAFDADAKAGSNWKLRGQTQAQSHARGPLVDISHGYAYPLDWGH